MWRADKRVGSGGVLEVYLRVEKEDAREMGIDVVVVAAVEVGFRR